MVSEHRRPARYSQKLGGEICRRLAGGENLGRICADPSMPTISTVMQWLFAERQRDFVAKYNRAREAQAELWAEEIVEIADGAQDRDTLAIAKLRTDIRRWAAAHLLPRRYGDKMEVSGDIAHRHEMALQELDDGE